MNFTCLFFAQGSIEPLAKSHGRKLKRSSRVFIRSYNWDLDEDKESTSIKVFWRLKYIFGLCIYDGHNVVGFH